VFSEIFIANEVDEVREKGSGKKAKLVVLGLLYSKAGLISGLSNVGKKGTLLYINQLV
jgi:hypothetical protein